jgi:hypothetical protein
MLVWTIQRWANDMKHKKDVAFDDNMQGFLHYMCRAHDLLQEARLKEIEEFVFNVGGSS